MGCMCRFEAIYRYCVSLALDFKDEKFVCTLDNFVGSIVGRLQWFSYCVVAYEYMGTGSKCLVNVHFALGILPNRWW